MREKILHGLFAETLQPVEDGMNYPRVAFASKISRAKLSEPNLHAQEANKFADIMFALYAFLYKIGFGLMILSCLWAVFRVVFRRDRSSKILLPLVACACFFILSVAYIIALGWFFGFADDLDISSFFYQAACKYYFLGVPALLILEILSGFCLVAEFIRRRSEAQQ